MRRSIAVLVSLAALVACGDQAPDAAVRPGTFVGQLRESDAYIALVSDGEQLGGFASDGKRISLWLKGDVDEGQSRLVSRRGQTVGQVRFSGDEADGHVVIGGRRHAFGARVATGQAGLYRTVKGEPGESGYEETGWIVLPDGSERGATHLVAPAGDDRTEPAPKRTTSTKTHSPRFLDPVTSN